eukprot:Clim_evm89s157 gene=Clim_evmTU89s157
MNFRHLRVQHLLLLIAIFAVSLGRVDAQDAPLWQQLEKTPESTDEDTVDVEVKPLPEEAPEPDRDGPPVSEVLVIIESYDVDSLATDVDFKAVLERVVMQAPGGSRVKSVNVVRNVQNGENFECSTQITGWTGDTLLVVARETFDEALELQALVQNIEDNAELYDSFSSTKNNGEVGNGKKLDGEGEATGSNAGLMAGLITGLTVLAVGAVGGFGYALRKNPEMADELKGRMSAAKIAVGDAMQKVIHRGHKEDDHEAVPTDIEAAGAYSAEEFDYEADEGPIDTLESEDEDAEQSHDLIPHDEEFIEESEETSEPTVGEDIFP